MGLILPEFLKTKRLTLRQMREEDCPVIAKLVNDWEIAQWLTYLPFPYSVDDAEFWLEKTRDNRAQKTALDLLIERNDDAVVLGFISLVLKDGRMGYWIRKDCWRQGYATETIHSVLDWALGENNLEKVFATTIPGNTGSQRTLEKAGLKFDGMRDYDFQKRGGIQSAPHYILHKTDWLKNDLP